MTGDHLQRAIELCLAVYRVTELFPREDPLRGKLRSLALDIIVSVVYHDLSIPTAQSRFFNFKNLNALFCVAEKQGWVKAENFSILRKAYNDLLDKFNNSHPQFKDEFNSEIGHTGKIVKFIKTNAGGVTTEEISKKIGLSERTVRRILRSLIDSGRIKRHGRTKGVKFLVVNNMS